MKSRAIHQRSSGEPTDHLPRRLTVAPIKGFALLAGVAFALATAVLPKAAITPAVVATPTADDAESTADEPLMSTAKRCSQCREVIPRVSRFCALCGAAQTPVSMAEAS